MKKVFVFCLAMVMVVTMGVTVFAAPGNFVSSPSGNQAPVLVSFENESDDCTGDIVITAYADRDTLNDATRELLEDAYNQIVDNAAFKEIADELAKETNIPVERMACSDLFDVSYVGCAEHADHGYFTITFKAETLKNFVGLLHLNNGNWEIIENPVVGNNGTTLTFKVDDFSPFAIIVDTGATDVPETGDRSMLPLWITLAVASALMLVLVSVKYKKAGAAQ